MCGTTIPPTRSRYPTHAVPRAAADAVCSVCQHRWDTNSFNVAPPAFLHRPRRGTAPTEWYGRKYRPGALPGRRVRPERKKDFAPGVIRPCWPSSHRRFNSGIIMRKTRRRPEPWPMAQDFKTGFYPGRDDKSITTWNSTAWSWRQSGVNQKLDEQKAENAAESRWKSWSSYD